MNYFDLYGIPVRFTVDKDLLRKRYYELSRKFHPDFFSQADAGEQEETLQKSADVNKAFKIFSSEDDTIRYLLKFKGLLEDEEKYRLSPEFLGEVLDINEQLMEIEIEPDPVAIDEVDSLAQELLKKIYHNVEDIIENYQEGVGSEEELLRVKEYYFRKKYILRILDKIRQLRNIATL